MAKRKANSILFLLFVLYVCANAVQGRILIIHDDEDLEFERQLKILNKPPVRTFKSESGHLYDCIDVYKQPAFDNPLLKDHKLQMSPSNFPVSMTDEQQPGSVNSKFPKNSTCPPGTVVIRRAQKNDLIHAKNMQNSFKRHVATVQPLATGPQVVSHYDVMKSDIGEYYGSSAKIIVYGLPNVGIDQGSVSQIWVIGGADGPADEVNTVQAGWHVSPSDNHGDTATHLSTFWTADGYKTGCWNLLCPGFITLSPNFGPGSEITLLSTYGGIQQSIEVTIFKDQKTENWWLAYGEERTNIGYWPKELFINLKKATEIDGGGAVYSPVNIPSPPMGSGHLPDEGPNKTCFFTNIHLIDHNNEFYDPNDKIVTVTSDNISQYYDIFGNYQSGNPDGYQFRFGGPGGWYKR